MSGKLNELTFIPDDKVRLAALKVYGALSYPVLLSRIGRSSLEVLADRVKDKKAAIRLEAMQVLARMWNFAYPDMYPLLRTPLTKVRPAKSQLPKPSPGFHQPY